MNDQNMSYSTRKQIEKRILTLADNIKLGGDIECFDSKAVEDFFSSWRDLVQYFKDNHDSDINVEVIREYIEWTDVFGGMTHNVSLSQECREASDEAYEELNGYLSDIILMVTRRLHPGGR